MGHCENDELDADEKADICVTTGPVLIVVQLLMQIFLAVYFSFIYFKRGTPDTRGVHAAVDKTDMKEDQEALKDDDQRKHVTPT